MHGITVAPALLLTRLTSYSFRAIQNALSLSRLRTFQLTNLSW
jgi:hypothetical protein